MQTTKTEDISYREKLQKLNMQTSQSTIRSPRNVRPVVSEVEIGKSTMIYDLEYDLSLNEDLDSDVVIRLIEEAYKFKGVRYRLGGMTHNGIDCSGLIVRVFQEQNIKLPRTSHEMSVLGKRLSKNELQKGDLLFFRTNRRRSGVSHVGMVVDVHDNNVYFIHSSSSKGVIVSSLNENYYTRAYSHASRIL